MTLSAKRIEELVDSPEVRSAPPLSEETARRVAMILRGPSARRAAAEPPEGSEGSAAQATPGHPEDPSTS